MKSELYKSNFILRIPTGSDEKYSFLFTTMFFLPSINGFLNEVFLVLGVPSISTFVYFIIYALSFYVYYVSIIQNYKKTAHIFVLSIFFFAFEILLFPGVADELFNFTGGLSGIALSNFFLLCFLGLPMLWIGLCLNKNNLEPIKRLSIKYSYVIVILFLVTMFLHFMFSQRFNYMTIAYNAVPVLLIMMYCWLEEKKKSAMILYIIGLILIFIGGCRGALLQLIVAAIIFFFVNNNSKLSIRKLLILLIGLILCLIFYMYFNQIMIYVGSVLSSFGFKSRVINMYLGLSGEGDLFHFDDRAELYSGVITEISLFGKGIFIYPINISYPHNIVLELMLGFGYIFGVLIFIYLCVLFIKSFRNVKSYGDRFEMIIWISAFTTVFVKLMVSASYLTDRPFWFYLAFIILFSRIGRKQNYA